MPIAKIRGALINYQVFGNDGPWLALTTGGRRAYGDFVSLAQKIASAGFRVLLHDRRNTGASSIVIDDYGRADSEEELWADDLHSLLEELGALPAFIGGGSSGARTSLLFYLRHPKDVRGLLLIRVTGGPFAAARLKESYYEQFIRAARQGGMAAVCATEQYAERLAANPAGRESLEKMDPGRYIEVMSRWRDRFAAGPHSPVLGITEAQLRSIAVPTIVIAGNDMVHTPESARAAQQLIRGAELFDLKLALESIALVPFARWASHEDRISEALASFMHRCVRETL
jgi:pimeloyl-ACP methyl ester carboxylesterase